MLDGDMGPARKWAMQHIMEVGRFFDAENLVDVAQAHIMAVTSPSVYADAKRFGIVEKIEDSGAMVLKGMCFYQSYAREMGLANGWRRLLTNSAKLTNIIGGYGYQPTLASMENCVKSAIAGEIL